MRQGRPSNIKKFKNKIEYFFIINFLIGAQLIEKLLNHGIKVPATKFIRAILVCQIDFLFQQNMRVIKTSKFFFS